jgi:hypothetical protein
MPYHPPSIGHAFLSDPVIGEMQDTPPVSSVSPALAAALKPRPKPGMKRTAHTIGGESFMPQQHVRFHDDTEQTTQKDDMLSQVMSRLSPSTAISVINELASFNKNPGSIHSPIAAAMTKQEQQQAVPKMRPAKAQKKAPKNLGKIINDAISKALGQPVIKPKTKAPKKPKATGAPKKTKATGANKGKTITIKLT